MKKQAVGLALLVAMSVAEPAQANAASLSLPRSTPEAQGIASQAIWENLYPAFQAEAMPLDSATQEKLARLLASLAAHPARTN